MKKIDLDTFVNDNIEFGFEDKCFEKVDVLYNRFLAYFDIPQRDAPLSLKRFIYLLRRDYLEMKSYKKKRFGDKVLPCFFNIRLKETRIPGSDVPPGHSLTQM